MLDMVKVLLLATRGSIGWVEVEVKAMGGMGVAVLVRVTMNPAKTLVIGGSKDHKHPNPYFVKVCLSVMLCISAVALGSETI